jgi:hypothetical protein
MKVVLDHKDAAGPTKKQTNPPSHCLQLQECLMSPNKTELPV